jgi:hypothetical protein
LKNEDYRKKELSSVFASAAPGIAYFHPSSGKFQRLKAGLVINTGRIFGKNIKCALLTINLRKYKVLENHGSRHYA